jgi:hypothetical protein
VNISSYQTGSVETAMLLSVAVTVLLSQAREGKVTCGRNVTEVANAGGKA